jgi:hypothetical protein
MTLDIASAEPAELRIVAKIATIRRARRPAGGA